MVSDVLLLSYLDKIGLSLTDEAGQASEYLYSEARLYKGASLALLSQSATTRSTGNISVGVKKVNHLLRRVEGLSVDHGADVARQFADEEGDLRLV